MTKPTNWLIVPLLAFVIAGSIGTNYGRATAATSLATALAVLATLDILLHRWNLRVALLINATAVAVYLACNFSNGPIYLSVPVLTFFVALSSAPRDWVRPAVAAVVLVGVGMVIRSFYPDASDHLGGGVWPLFGLAGLVAAAGAVATTIRTRRDAAADRALRAASEEQLRMAQDLHDGVGHGLAVIAMQAGVALHVLDKDPAAARTSLLAIRETSKESLAALRAELSRMQPGEHAPIRVRRGLADLDVLVDRVRAGGLAVTVSAAPGVVPDPVDEAAYVVVQEALTNVLRHASATTADVTVLRDGDNLVVSVTDDGQGGAVASDNPGMGISGMRARAERLGGSLEAGPLPNGFQVRAVLPVGDR